MSAVYRNNGYLATDCPVCGQEVRVDRLGDELRFTCRGGCEDSKLRQLLDPAVMVEPGGGPPSQKSAERTERLAANPHQQRDRTVRSATERSPNGARTGSAWAGLRAQHS